MKSLIRLADRKGLLKGHLNAVQEEALQWLMVDEAETTYNAERERMKYTILAGNVNLWKYLFEDEENREDYEVDDEEVEWITPSSHEDIEAMDAILRGIGGEN